MHLVRVLKFSALSSSIIERLREIDNVFVSTYVFNDPDAPAVLRLNEKQRNILTNARIKWEFA